MTSYSYIAYLIISSVQLGATVDYAILLTSRYMEVRETASRKDTVVETLRSTTVSIMTSASNTTNQAAHEKRESVSRSKCENSDSASFSSCSNIGLITNE